ncbi:MAG: glycoside hydrolase [Chloroflexi bacterium]|nr:glycoside hydrolase [Chloroflexota bacterium]
MIIKASGSKPGVVRVTFQLPSSIAAQTVHVVGDFNDWNRHSHALTRSAPIEDWHLSLELEAGRAYQFRYLIDGTNWQNDWHADRYVSNPFGGENSVLVT